MSEALPIRDARPKEFFWAHNRLIDDYGPIIGADGVAVYMALCRHAGESQTCWPSYQTVADELCLSRPTVVKAIKKLVAVGLVASEQRANPDHPDLHLSNLYTLLAIPSLDEGGKAHLLGVVKEINHPGKAGLPGVVKEINGGGKGALQEENTEKKTHKKNRAAPKARARTPRKQAATEPLFSDETVPEEASGRGPAKGAHQALIDAYVQELGYTPASMSAEGKAAKWLVENGYTPEQVVGCYRAMKRDAFWEKKHLSLMSLQKQIGAWLAAQRYQARPQQPEERPETPAERDAREARLYEEKYSKLRTVHPSYYRTPAS